MKNNYRVKSSVSNTNLIEDMNKNKNISKISEKKRKKKAAIGKSFI